MVAESLGELGRTKSSWRLRLQGDRRAAFGSRHPQALPRPRHQAYICLARAEVGMARRTARQVVGNTDINTTYSIYGHLIAEEPPDLKFE